MIRFRLGTRGSPLALTQANMVRDALCAAHGWSRDQVELVVIRTTGDRVQDRALAEIGGKALWTKELDRALLGEEIDAAVHSMKDVETVRPDAIAIAAMLPRADVRDRLIGATSPVDLPLHATLGTSSPRRRAQMLRHRPDLNVVLLRGNVETRLAKLAAGEVGVAVPTDLMLPAPAQGAVGIEVRRADSTALVRLAAIDDAPTHVCVAAERALLAALRADCHSPVAALASLAGETLSLRAELLSEDGVHSVEGAVEGAVGEPLGDRLAADLLARAPDPVRRLFGA